MGIVNGAHETSTAQQLVDKFIDKFVLCPNCKLPEIDMMVKKGFLMAGCKACGWQGDMDNTHKLVKFIITNPPGSEAAGFTIANKKKAKKEKKKEKKKKEKGSDDDDDEDDDAKDKKKKAKKGDDDDEDLEYTDELIVESTKRLAKFVKEQETKGKLGKDKFYDEARMIQIQNAYSTKLRMYVALQSLFDA